MTFVAESLKGFQEGTSSHQKASVVAHLLATFVVVHLLAVMVLEHCLLVAIVSEIGVAIVLEMVWENCSPSTGVLSVRRDRGRLNSQHLWH